MSLDPKPEGEKPLPEAVTELSLASPAVHEPRPPTPSAVEAAANAKPPALSHAELDEVSGLDQNADWNDASRYVGLTLGDRYHIESILARGGMGVVYRARHRLLDKQVAVKILRPELAGNRELTSRFITEAKAASAIGSDHIVNVTDFGELPDGATYIVMEYLDGLPLSRVLKLNGPRLPPALVLDIARQVSTGLGKAHAARIIHRDLKPDNLLVLQTERSPNFVKILDFGIAKVASSQNETTRAGRIFGTPHYMSPEQARGDSLDLRTDIYALGVMLFEMLTGTKPFDAESPLGVLTQHLCVEAPLLADRAPSALLSLDWEIVVACCLAKNREDRYASLSELDADLACLQAGTAPSALVRVRQSPNISPRIYAQLRKKRFREVGLRFGIAGALVATSLFAFGPLRATVDKWSELGLRKVADTTSSTGRSAVDLVLSPIDAHVFRGTRDLGPMPIRVEVRRDNPVELSIRRAGFVTRRISVDGTSARIEVVLTPLAGATPAPRPAVTFGPLRTIILEGTGADEPSSEPSGEVAGTPVPTVAQQADGNPSNQAIDAPLLGLSSVDAGATRSLSSQQLPGQPPGPPPRQESSPRSPHATGPSSAGAVAPIPGPPPRVLSTFELDSAEPPP